MEKTYREPLYFRKLLFQYVLSLNGIITKLPTDWTKNQRARAKLLFESYPKIEEAYKHCMEFRGSHIFSGD